MKINKERTGLGLSFDSPVNPEELKKKIERVAECIGNAFVPSNITWEGSSYSFYISHRQSLKDYIYENELKLKDFYAVLEAFEKLFYKSQKNHIDIYEFIYDYECIFVGNSISELEFIYAPDKKVYKNNKIDNNKFSEMIAILSLHIEFSEKEKSESVESDISQLLEEISAFENKAFMEADFLHELLNRHSYKKTNYCENAIIYIKNKLSDLRNRFIKITDKKEGNIMKLQGKMLLNGTDFSEKDGTTNSVNIGRDAEWADVPIDMIFVSRKHATVYKNNNNWYVKDLNSKNGTFVNGVKIASGCIADLKNGCEISFGLPEMKLIFCLP